MTPEFRNALYQWRFESKAETEDQAVVEATKCIPYQLQRLFLQLQVSPGVGVVKGCGFFF